MLGIRLNSGNNDKARKPRQKATPAKAPGGPGVFSRVVGGVRGGWSWTKAAAPTAGKVCAALMFLGLGVGWVVGKEPLERYVASMSAPPSEIRFNWPVVAPAKGERSRGPRETWLPNAVRQDLVAIASKELVQDPFSQASLERTRRALLATGWFARVRTIERLPGGRVQVIGDWRVPAAVVRHKGKDILVARGGEPLKLPARTPVAAGTLAVIMNPHSGPSFDAQGQLAYGLPWPGGDVQSAIDLLTSVRSMPESKRLKGVDLASYMDKGHLTLVTDTGSRIVWGSAPGEVAPGEVPADRRMGRLKDILAQRFDAEQPSIAIYTPVVLVDKTAQAAASEN